MQDKVLHNTLTQRMKSFYEEYFDRAPENRFEAFLAGGHRSLPVMLDCLESDEADSEARTDALIAIGRVLKLTDPRPTHWIWWFITRSVCPVWA